MPDSFAAALRAELALMGDTFSLDQLDAAAQRVNARDAQPVADDHVTVTRIQDAGDDADENDDAPDDTAHGDVTDTTGAAV